MTAVRRLTGDAHLPDDFATTWPSYELDAKTKALLAYASKLTESPSLIDRMDIDALKQAGWGERDVWELTALVSFFNFSGRMEAASGLPQDVIPANTPMPEVRR